MSPFFAPLLTSLGEETVLTWLLTTDGNLDSDLSILPDLLTGVRICLASVDFNLEIGSILIKSSFPASLKMC